MALLDKGKCLNCGHPHPSFGYSRRNARQLSPEKRTTIWVCGAQACRDRAEAWKAKADGTTNPLAARSARKPETPPAQAALF